MKNKEIESLFPEETDKLPVSYHVWHITEYSELEKKETKEDKKEKSVASTIHNSDYHSIKYFHKPISKLINFKINDY